MPSNYEKLDRPTGPSLDTIAVPEKAALSAISNVTTINASPRGSTSTPRSDKLNPFDTDVEAMMPTTTNQTCRSNMPQKSDCTVWPSQDAWRQKAKAAKKQRGCTCMAGLSRRNKIIAKVLIVFLIVGIAVGVGFGVSKPLGAPIWGEKDHKN